MQELLYYIAILIYTSRVVYFFIGAAKERSKKSGNVNDADLPFVSIIIPARNEELNLVECIESVFSVDYPREKFEVIIVDDRSSDSTPSLLLMQQFRFPNLITARINSDGEKNLQGKAGALDYGIQRAKGEILLFTDADCTVHTQWVREHAKVYQDSKVAMVCAFTLIDGNNLFQKIQSVEWISTHTMASASVYYKQFLGCFGNNLSIKTTMYKQLGGYASIPFSVTEDLALMQQVGKQRQTIRYLCSIESSVKTKPCISFTEYLQQHKRWVRGATQLGWRATVFVSTSMAFWVGLALSIITLHPWWFFGFLTLRLIGDYVVNAPTLSLLKRNYLLIYSFPTVIFFSLLELSLPFMLLDPTISWKGQKLKM